jgi:hypothetical protein
MSDAPIDIGPVGHGAPSDGDPEPEPGQPPRRSRTRLIVLQVLVVVTVAAAALVGYFAWQILTQKDARMAAPAQIGTLRLDSTPDGQSPADYLQTALAAEIDLDKTVGGVYVDGDKNVLFFGGTGLIWSPDNTLDSAFGLISDKQGDVTGLHEIAAGKLGGTMKCGTTKSDDGDLAVCGWADHGSVAVAMFPNRTEPDAAPLLRQIRDATESR